MSQILLIGSGRLAKHLGHYFRLLGVEIDQWSRRPLDEFNSASASATEFPDPKVRLGTLLPQATHVLLAVSDQGIHEFIGEYGPELDGKTCVHFSGAQTIKGFISTHPLMSFANELYDLPTYQSVPFVLDVDKPLDNFLPGLKNPWHHLAPEHRALYHAYCVVAGNFTTLLWSAVSERMESNCELPREILWPYLRQVTKNIEWNSSQALTGPLARGDVKTIRMNLEALAEDPLQDIYNSFLKFKGIKVDP